MIRKSRQTSPTPQNRSTVLDHLATTAARSAEERMRGYREQSLRIHPQVCARCGREFARENLIELTVHHKDHNHDNNPPDGSNWENLCIYCHDNEHARQVEYLANHGITADQEVAAATHSPFAELQKMIESKRNG